MVIMMSLQLGLSLCAIGDIYRQVTSCPCVLLVTYVTIAWAIFVCYQRHKSAQFISLNFAGIFRIETRISTQLSMMSPGENESVNAVAFNLFTGSLTNIFAQKLTIVWVICVQIQLCMCLRWNCISFYQLQKSLNAGIREF